MKKKLLAVTLLLTGLFIFTGCSKKETITIKEGDIWKRDSGRYYMYISNDTINRHYFESGVDASTSSISSNVKAAGTQGGMWLLGNYWATRSLIYNS